MHSDEWTYVCTYVCVYTVHTHTHHLDRSTLRRYVRTNMSMDTCFIHTHARADTQLQVRMYVHTYICMYVASTGGQCGSLGHIHTYIYIR